MYGCIHKCSLVCCFLVFVDPFVLIATSARSAGLQYTPARVYAFVPLLQWAADTAFAVTLHATELPPTAAAIRPRRKSTHLQTLLPIPRHQMITFRILGLYLNTHHMLRAKLFQIQHRQNLLCKQRAQRTAVLRWGLQNFFQRRGHWSHLGLPQP